MSAVHLRVRLEEGGSASSRHPTVTVRLVSDEAAKYARKSVSARSFSRRRQLRFLRSPRKHRPEDGIPHEGPSFAPPHHSDEGRAHSHTGSHSRGEAPAFSAEQISFQPFSGASWRPAGFPAGLAGCFCSLSAEPLFGTRTGFLPGSVGPAGSRCVLGACPSGRGGGEAGTRKGHADSGRET